MARDPQTRAGANETSPLTAILGSDSVLSFALRLAHVGDTRVLVDVTLCPRRLAEAGWVNIDVEGRCPPSSSVSTATAILAAHQLRTVRTSRPRSRRGTPKIGWALTARGHALDRGRVASSSRPPGLFGSPKTTASLASSPASRSSRRSSSSAS